MIRDKLGDSKYWARWTVFDDQTIAEVWAEMAQPSANPAFEPQFCFNQARRHWEAMLRRYSAGRPVSDLVPLFDGLLRAWERSVELGASVFTPEQKQLRNSWAQNLDFYVCCFWVVGLALALDLPEPQWQRLLRLVGNEGEDTLLDRIIATRSPGRRIGTRLAHPEPYARLLAALPADGAVAPGPDSAAQLADFVAHWHAGLDRKATKGKPALYNRPYWHRFGDENFEGGAYFGRWCVEAVAAVKAFGLDDSRCLAHPHYPAALLHPDPERAATGGAAAPAPVAAETQSAAAAATQPRGLLQKLFGRR